MALVTFYDNTPFMLIYDYTNPLSFMADYIESRKTLKPGFSIRKWAKEMNLNGHALLVMLLKGKRSLRIKHLDFLGDGLRLSSNERMYFQTLIQYHNAQDLKEKRLYEHFLSELHPKENFSVKELDEFKVISDWYHMSILALTNLKDFEMSTENITSRLQGKVSAQQVDEAIERLIQMGLLERLSRSQYRATYYRVSTADDVVNLGAREYNKQVMDLAKEAIDQYEPEEREFQSFVMAVAKDKVPLAKEMIREFRQKLSKAGSGQGDEVYQTNIQFFQLTKDPSLGGEGVEAENKIFYEEKK